MRPTPLLVAAAALTAAILTGCIPGDNEYSEFKDIQPQGWAYNDTLLFTPSTADTVSRGPLSIALRHNNSYEYSNLWVELTWHDGPDLRRDTLNIILADSHGSWQGKGFGPSYQLEVPVNPQAVMTDSAPMAIRHIMRVDTLTGIEQIGLIYAGKDRN